MFRTLFQSVVVTAVLLFASAVVWADEAPVVFTAHDYGFNGPDRLPTGLTTMQIVNQGAVSSSKCNG